MGKFYTNVHRRGNNILLRGYDENGTRVKEKVAYQPYLFVPAEEGNYRTLHGHTVDKKQFDSIRDAKEFIDQFKEVSNFSFYGMKQWIYPFIFDNYRAEIKYDPSIIKVANIDIEVASDDGFPDIQDAIKEVTAICLRVDGFSHVFGCGDFVTDDPKVRYVKCVDEEALLRAFLAEWNIISPDVVTGWNIEFFDIPYLVNRITNIIGEEEAKRLSPWGLLEEKTIEIHGRENQVFVPVGVSVLDYYNMYRKFTYTTQESYKLDHIAFVEIGERKIDYSEYESLLKLYKENYQKFIEYNIHDCALVERIDDKLKLLELVYAMAYDAKVNFADALTSVRLWDVIIHNYLLERRVVVPQFVLTSDDEGIVGGYVKNPKIGQHEWVVSFDLNSLYPHLIMQYNISPETYVGSLRELTSGDDKEGIVGDIINGAFDEFETYREHYAIAANYKMYRRDKQGFLPALMEKMYADRKVYKDQMNEVKKQYEENKTVDLSKEISRLHNLQMAKKIQLNSAYGALANPYFRWFDTRHAEAITMSGQLSIRWIERDINIYLNKLLETKEVDYVVASDTDSIYVTLAGLVDKCFTKDKQSERKDKIITFLDKACETQIQSTINRSYSNLAEYVGAYQQKMLMKREVIADKGIWRGKKMYVLNIWYNEDVRYKEPKLKTMGIEVVRSSIPAICREAMKKALNIIMLGTQDDLFEFIEDFENKFMEAPVEDIASPRGLNGMEKYHDASSIYKSKTPIHVKGALMFNHIIKQKKLEKKYTYITNGNKVKFIYLKEPNPTHETVISFSGILPPQLGLHKYIDRDLQFEKTFLAPVESITNVIGWETKKVANLKEFFC